MYVAVFCFKLSSCFFFSFMFTGKVGGMASSYILAMLLVGLFFIGIPPSAHSFWGKVGWSSWCSWSFGWFLGLFCPVLAFGRLSWWRFLDAVQLLKFLSSIASIFQVSSTTVSLSIVGVHLFFGKSLPLILLSKFTTSGVLQGHTLRACLHIFFKFLGAVAPFSKTPDSPKGWK